MKKLILGTRNAKKKKELIDLIGDLPWEIIDLNQLPHAKEIEETGSTFEENARLKAVGVAQMTGEWTLAEDSGLVVPALHGAPGVYSARYGGTQGNDRANNDRLLAELAQKKGVDRSAYFTCTAILVDPTGCVVAQTEGRCQGEIIQEPRGEGGFGYDPLFLVREYHKTFGELSQVVKQSLSHRSRAIQKLRPMLLSYALSS